jgi:hypothetical protein
MFGPSQRTPEMSIDISLGDFHRTHDAAHEAVSLIKAGLDQIPSEKLLDILAALRAGQALTDAETGDDFMFAASYRDEIKMVEEAMRSSVKTISVTKV